MDSKLTGGLPTLSLTTNSSWLPWGRVAMPLISPLMPVPHVANLLVWKMFTVRLSPLFSLVHWHCWLGDRKGIQPVKSWVLVCWWWFDWRFARRVAPVATTTSIILSSSKIQNGDILVQLTQIYLKNGRENGERVYDTTLVLDHIGLTM